MRKNPETRLPTPTPTKGGEGTGVRYDLRLYVFADGHGNITGRDADGPFNLPVDAGDDALEHLAKIWRKGRQAAARGETRRLRAPRSKPDPASTSVGDRNACFRLPADVRFPERSRRTDRPWWSRQWYVSLAER